MKRLLILTVAALAMTGCAELFERNDNLYDNPFYAKYLNTGSALDAQIQKTLEALRQNPGSPRLHNDLGMLLVQKGFPKDAEREFERSVNADGDFYPAWYNLGLVRAARGDEQGAGRVFRRTVANKPGHAAALFQLGLIEEKSGDVEKAVKHYAKAYSINPALMDVRVNPRIVDSRLTHLALIENYPKKHAKDSMQFHGVPSGYREPMPEPALSPEAPPQKIVPPTPAPTDPTQLPPPVTNT
jgi:tetratricopeptide (TPR) repeat protein